MDGAPEPQPPFSPWLYLVVFLPPFLVGIETGKALSDWDFWPRLGVVVGAAVGTALVISGVAAGAQRLLRRKGK
jgi:hypothetical protein